jgi:periplasmic divalent cation tolerance protein
MSEDFGMALISAPPEAGELIARALIENHAAACVQVVPGATSLYWWKGKIEYGNEVLLLVKTLASKLAKIELLLKELHPYEVPELLFLPIRGGSEKYLAWLAESVHHGEFDTPTL